MSEEMSLLTASRLSAARSCQRLHRLRYGLGWRPVEDAEALRFGTLVHRGLEAWWKAWGWPSEAQLAAALDAMAGDVDPFERVRAEEMMRGYHYRWERDDYEVIDVECVFETALRNPATGRPSHTWRLGGKIDAIVKDVRTGRVLTVEHKTASGDISPGSEYWRRLRMDGQVSIYYEGATSLGHDVAGCLYDVLGKPGQKPLKATPEEARKYKKDGTLYAAQRDRDETPDEYRERVRAAIAENPDGYYQRGEVVRLESEMAEALHDVWQVGQQIREAELAARFPRNPGACVQYGRTCSFFAVCTGEASLEHSGLYAQSSTIHPELADSAG